MIGSINVFFKKNSRFLLLFIVEIRRPKTKKRKKKVVVINFTVIYRSPNKRCDNNDYQIIEQIECIEITTLLPSFGQRSSNVDYPALLLSNPL